MSAAPSNRLSSTSGTGKIADASGAWKSSRIDTEISTPMNSAIIPNAPRRINLLGLPISVVTETQANNYIVDCCKAGSGGWVITPNLDQLRQFKQKPDLHRLYDQARLIVADGKPLVWASRIQGTPLPERVAGSSMIITLSKAAAENGLSVYLLGGNEGAAEGAGKKLQEQFPGLNIVGHYMPQFGFEKNPVEMEFMKQDLLNKKPDIIFVGLGFPKQEILIEQLKPLLPAAWFLGIGISFSFITGEVKRAPGTMQNLGLEWMHRMWQEPSRLFGRYIRHGIPFAFRLFFGAAWARLFTPKDRLSFEVGDVQS